MVPERTLVPLGRVLPLVAVALVAELGAWGALAATGRLAGPWYGVPGLLAAVHGLTVGTLAAAIVGVGWQLVPVVTAHPWRPGLDRVIPAVNAALLVGLPLLTLGWFRPGLWLGAGLVVAALAARSILVLAALLDPGRQAVGRAAPRAWLVLAEACLLAGVAVGALLWAGRAGVPVLRDPIAGVGLHVRLLLGGWVGGWVVGAGALLLPMFAVAREPRPALLALAGAAWFAGLLAPSPWAFAAGAVLVAVALGGAVARGLKRTPGITQAALGLGVLAALAVAGGALPEAALPADARVLAGLAGVALPVLHGVALRIVPFLAWNHLVPGRPAPATLVAPGLAWAQAALGFAGAALAVAGRLGAGEGAARLGPALCALGAGMVAWALARAVWTAWRTGADWTTRRAHGAV